MGARWWFATLPVLGGCVGCETQEIPGGVRVVIAAVVLLATVDLADRIAAWRRS